jgi:SNF2 family DNA or RNA helicase
MLTPGCCHCGFAAMLLLLCLGHMPMHQRTRAIEAFQKDPPTTVFILTLQRCA